MSNVIGVNRGREILYNKHQRGKLKQRRYVKFLKQLILWETSVFLLKYEQGYDYSLDEDEFIDFDDWE